MSLSPSRMGEDGGSSTSGEDGRNCGEINNNWQLQTTTITTQEEPRGGSRQTGGGG